MRAVQPDPTRPVRPPEAGLARRVSVEVERTVDAPMEAVWAVLQDYRAARPCMLTEHFTDYVVRRRGEGAGTVVEYRLRFGRRERRYELTVEEPTPGRQLRERDRDSWLVTTWTLTPGGDGELTVVRLVAHLRDPDVSGWLARLWARRALRRVHGQLLERLDTHLAESGR